MITFKQYITEARMAPLYHATSLPNAEQALKTKLIKLGTNKSISLTRNFIFAINWIREHPSWVSSGGGVIFEFDQLKLTHRHKIVPYNFIGTVSPDRFPTRGFPREITYTKGKDYDFDNQFEEAVRTPIKDPLKYITKIYVAGNEIPPFLEKIANVPIYSYSDKRRIR